MSKPVRSSIYSNVRTSLMKYVENNVSDLYDEIANEIAETFCHRVKNRIKYNSQGVKESQPYLDKVASIVTFTKRTKKKEASVTAYQRGSGLFEDFLFLEYGTGLKGMENPHPEASQIGWKYAINRKSYFRAYKREGYGKKKGWSFRLISPSSQFVTKDDISRPFTKKILKGSDGETVKYYQQRSGFSHWIHTTGIKPIRAFYNTKREFQRFLSHYNEGNYGNLIKKLKKMRGEKPTEGASANGV